MSAGNTVVLMGRNRADGLDSNECAPALGRVLAAALALMLAILLATSSPIPKFPAVYHEDSRLGYTDTDGLDRDGTTTGGHSMHPIDRTILEHGYDSFRPLSELRQQVPQGSLYRHVSLLCKLGFLEKESSFYRTTESGRRALVIASTDRTFDGFATVYAPIAEVPTPTHRVMAELIFAAAVARHHKIRSDRHPFFAAVGQTLRWKTSLGQFCCYALGLDPAQHIVECGSETGKSLAIRRDHSGAILFKRELLGAALVVLDEYLSADPSVRPSLQLFLTGRLEVPFENSQLMIKPVSLLTLNARDRPTLEARIGLSAPQIRRGLIANFDNVPIPDLAMVGDRAVLAAKQAPPLRLDAPTVDCARYQPVIVQALRHVLAPAAHSRIDVQVVMTLCSGMSAFLHDAETAIVQVLYGVGMLAETMEWTNPAWIEPVLRFSLTAGASVVRHEDTLVPSLPISGQSSGHSTDSSTQPAMIPLQVPRLRRETAPSLSVGEALKNRLIWAAVDTGQTLEEFLTTLLNVYLTHRQDPNTFPTLKHALRIAGQLQLAEVEVSTLRNYLAAEIALRRAGLWFDDLTEVLQLMPLLEGLPQSWTWTQAQYAMRTVVYMLRQGIDTTQIGEFLAFHHALEQSGITEAYFVELISALEDAGVQGPRKRRILDRLIAQAALQVDVEDLQHQAHTLKGEITRLEAQRKALRTRVDEWRSRVETLSAQETAGRARVEGLAGEVAGYEQERTMLQAIRLLLERQQAGPHAPHAAVQPSQHTEPGEPPRHAQPATPQYDQRWEQLLLALRQLGGQSKTAPQEGTT